MPTVALSNLAVRAHDGRDAVRRLAGPLRAAGVLPAPVIEMDPEYLGTGFEEHPGALVAYSGDRPVAYLPYVLRHTRFPIALGPAAFARFPCRQLVIFGYAADVPYDAPVLDRLFRLVTDADTWDVIQAFQLPIDDPLAVYLRRNPLGSGHRYRVVSRVFDTIHVTLATSFDDYLSEQFSRKTRYNLRREVRLLEDSARVVVRVCTAPWDVTSFMQDADAIARRTYQWKLRFGAVRATPDEIRRVTFLAERGHWRGYLLSVDDVPAAYCHATVRWGALSYDAVGYDPDFARSNPGKVLLYRIIEDLHAWRSVDRLEFGRGAAEYKRLFANGEACEVDATLYRTTRYAEMLRQLALFADAGYHRLRPLVRPCMPYVKRLLRGTSLPGQRRDAAARVNATNER